MKIREILEVHNFIVPLKLNKLDEKVRFALISNYPLMDKVVKDNEEYKKSLQEKMFEDHKEDAEKVQALRSKIVKDMTAEQIAELNKEAEQYAEYLKLEAEFIKHVVVHMEEDVDITLSKVDRDVFIESLSKAEVDFTLDDLQKLNILFN